MNKKKSYCGIGKIPKDQVRGTPEYCVQNNQIRYYGLHKIDKDLLKTAKGQVTNLNKEKLKLKRLEDDARILIKTVKNLKIILEDRDSTPSQIKKAQKKMDEIAVKKDKLIKKLATQKKVIDEVIAEEALREREQEKRQKKSSESKTKRRSGSKKSRSKNYRGGYYWPGIMI